MDTRRCIKSHGLWWILAGVVVALCLEGCGTKEPPEIPVTLTFKEGEDPFATEGLADILFVVAEADSADDLQTVFPKSCVDDSSKTLLPPDQCSGFSKDEISFRLNLSGFAAGASLILKIWGRNTDGDRIFSGESPPFTNDNTTTDLSIEVGLETQE